MSNTSQNRQLGSVMIEVLVTFIVVTLGLLGIAALFARSHQMNDESFQYFRALQIASQLAEEMAANPTELAKGAASAYVTGGTVLQSFEDTLNGVAKGGVTDLVNPLGCVTFVGVAGDVTNPPRFQVSVAWAGRQASGAPAATASNCGSDQYGDEALRRVVSLEVQGG